MEDKLGKTVGLASKFLLAILENSRLGSSGVLYQGKEKKGKEKKRQGKEQEERKKGRKKGKEQLTANNESPAAIAGI